VYRWQIQMATSILHRVTGIILTVGSLIIAGGLFALMMGPESWNCFTTHAGAWYGKVILFGWSWCFAYHLCNGIRHIVQDFAIGYAKATFIRSSWGNQASAVREIDVARMRRVVRDKPLHVVPQEAAP